MIQGTEDSELTPEKVLDIGKTLGMQYKYITVGMNMNPSSMMILSSLMAGMTSTGADVRNAGILPTPAIPFATEKTECCVMVGNPDDQDRVSGLTFLNTDGRYFNGPQMFAFSNRLAGEKILPGYSSIGNVRPYNGALDKYQKKISEFAGSADCQIVIDCASDSPSYVVPNIMKTIGADAMMVSCQTDLRQRGTWANPEEYNIRMLSKIVKANFGSIGVALNSDGTRIAALDENGDAISGDALLQLFIKYLQPRKIAVPIDVTMGVREQLKGSVKLCKLGRESIAETMKIDGIEFGGTADGTFVFRNNSYASDGIAAAALLTKIATEASIGDMVDELPVYCRDEDTIRYPANREIIAKRITSKINDIEYRELNVTDGWRVEMESGLFLIRFSDNDYTIEIKGAATTEIYTAGMMEIAKDIVTDAIKAVQ
jgi:phosphoglucosamine mutase